MAKPLTLQGFKRVLAELVAEQRRWYEINNGAAMGSYSCRLYVRDHRDQMIRAQARVDGMAVALGLSERAVERLRREIEIHSVRQR